MALESLDLYTDSLYFSGSRFSIHTLNKAQEYIPLTSIYSDPAGITLEKIHKLNEPTLQQYLDTERLIEIRVYGDSHYREFRVGFAKSVWLPFDLGDSTLATDRIQLVGLEFGGYRDVRNEPKPRLSDFSDK